MMAMTKRGHWREDTHIHTHTTRKWHSSKKEVMVQQSRWMIQVKDTDTDIWIEAHKLRCYWRNRWGKASGRIDMHLACICVVISLGKWAQNDIQWNKEGGGSEGGNEDAEPKKSPTTRQRACSSSNSVPADNNNNGRTRQAKDMCCQFWPKYSKLSEHLTCNLWVSEWRIPPQNGCWKIMNVFTTKKVAVRLWIWHSFSGPRVQLTVTQWQCLARNSTATNNTHAHCLLDDTTEQLKQNVPIWDRNW